MAKRRKNNDFLTPEMNELQDIDLLYQSPTYQTTRQPCAWKAPVRKQEKLLTTEDLQDSISQDIFTYGKDSVVRARSELNVMIKFDLHTYLSMRTLVNAATEEIGWFSSVDITHYKGTTIYYISKMIIPHQKVSPASVGITPEVVSTMCYDMAQANQHKEVEKMRFWGHSHVKMGITPSTVDTTQMHDFMQTADYMIMCIMNKQSEMHLQISYNTPGIDIINVPWTIEMPDSSTEILEMLHPATTNVTTEIYDTAVERYDYTNDDYWKNYYNDISKDFPSPKYHRKNAPATQRTTNGQQSFTY